MSIIRTAIRNWKRIFNDYSERVVTACCQEQMSICWPSSEVKLSIQQNHGAYANYEKITTARVRLNSGVQTNGSQK